MRRIKTANRLWQTLRDLPCAYGRKRPGIPGTGHGEAEPPIFEFHEEPEPELGCHLAGLQVFCGGQEGHLHDECHRVTEFHRSEAEPPEERISQRHSTVESAVSGCVRGGEEMDDADPKLKAGLWGIEYHV